VKNINANKKFELLSNFFLTIDEPGNYKNSFSLLSGGSGLVLVQSLLFKHTGDIRYKEKVETNIDFIVKEAEASDSLSPTYCYGMAGFGWLLLYLNENQILEIDPDEFLVDIDEMLSNYLDFFLNEENFDLLHGALGIGLYYLKRGEIKKVELIIRKLFNSSEKLLDEIKWQRYEKYSNIRDYDFGLSHGQAGIIYFLTKCIKNNILSELCKEMIYGSINFYWNNIQDSNTVGSFFPSSIICEDYKNANRVKYPSRLAWCYGDLGILHTFFLFANYVEDKVLLDKVEDMLIEVSKRTETRETGLEDAQFCHGSSGVGYIYLNLYHITNNIVFKRAADFWMKEVLMMGENDEKGIIGYLFHDRNMGWVPKTGVLSGISGILLFLASYIDPGIKSNWNECLFLS
jgi:lantibiotic modifying enzyme